MGDVKSFVREGVMRRQANWVIEEQKKYVEGLLIRADHNAKRAGKVYMLRKGLTTLWELSQGKPWGGFVSQKQIKARTPDVKDSPTAGLWAWLNRYDAMLGAGIVEGDPDQGYRIREEFWEAVDRVLGATTGGGPNVARPICPTLGS